MRHSSTAIGVVCTMALFVNGAIDLCAQEPTVKDIVNMWSERQVATKTATFQWVETVTVPQEPPPGEEQSVTTSKHDRILRIGEGERMRSESIPLRNPSELGDSLARSGLTVSAFNGNRNVYYTAAAGPDDHHRGIEFDAKVYDEIVNYQLRPVILCYRPLLVVQSIFTSKDSRVVRDDAKLRIIDRDATLAGTPCLIIESSSDAPVPISNRYWVDVARRGLILKHVESVAGRTTAEMTIIYKKDEVNGWAPAIWRGRFLNSSISGLVTDYKINQKIGADMFEIAYPPGTVVFDREQNKQWRVLKNGKKEFIVPE